MKTLAVTLIAELSVICVLFALTIQEKDRQIRSLKTQVGVLYVVREYLPLDLVTSEWIKPELKGQDNE